jgi:quercetin dioxygenase-like cupin family protein
MKTKIHPKPALSGPYDLRLLEAAAIEGASLAQIGLVRIAAGTRSPTAGYRASARHEIAFVAEGRLQVDTPDESMTVDAGTVLVSSPAEMHATTALTDSTIFFALIDPV